jgi:hypothetical protein
MSDDEDRETKAAESASLSRKRKKHPDDDSKRASKQRHVESEEKEELQEQKGEPKDDSATKESKEEAFFQREYEKKYVEFVAVGSWKFPIPAVAWSHLLKAFIRGLEPGKLPAHHAVMARFEERLEEIKRSLLYESVHTKKTRAAPAYMEHAFQAMRWVNHERIIKPKRKTGADPPRACVFTGATQRLISMTMMCPEGQFRLPELASIPPGSDMRHEVFVLHERYEWAFKALAYVLHFRWHARQVFMKLDDSTHKTDIERQEAWTQWADMSHKNFNEACAFVREFFMSDDVYA